MKIGQKIKCGHHRGVVTKVDDDSAIVNWGPPKQCMCARKPGIHLKRDRDGGWWAEAIRHYWHNDTHIETIHLDSGIQCELEPVWMD
jgi:hypothetical protein